MSDTMTYFNMANRIGKQLDKVFPMHAAGTALGGRRLKVYKGVTGPAGLLRCMADLIDPPAPKRQAKAAPAAKPVAVAPAPKAAAKPKAKPKAAAKSKTVKKTAKRTAVRSRKKAA